MADHVAEDVVASAGMPAMLELICRTTGMEFAAIGRFTEDRWIACGIRDGIGLGLHPGEEMLTETAICRAGPQAIVIEDPDDDRHFGVYQTSQIDGLQNYISVPIHLEDGGFFGTLCAFDRAPRRLNSPETLATLATFAEVIGSHLTAIDRLAEERRASALREHFIAVLGHDLRNPLTGILGGMEMLLKNPLNERATQWAHMVVGSAGRMAGLIDTIMDFSRGRQGAGLTLERDAHDSVEAVLGQIVAGVQDSKPLHVIETVLDVAVPVDCDLKRLAQLTTHLLSNALTHGDPAHPVRLTAIAADGRFELSVTNAGAPIPEAMMRGIFEPFSRGVVQSGEDLGLGLYMSQQIALAHGGDLLASSNERETRFTFRMPN